MFQALLVWIDREILFFQQYQPYAENELYNSFDRSGINQQFRIPPVPSPMNDPTPPTSHPPQPPPPDSYDTLSKNPPPPPSQSSQRSNEKSAPPFISRQPSSRGKGLLLLYKDF